MLYLHGSLDGLQTLRLCHWDRPQVLHHEAVALGVLVGERRKRERGDLSQQNAKTAISRPIHNLSGILYIKLAILRVKMCVSTNFELAFELRNLMIIAERNFQWPSKYRTPQKQKGIHVQYSKS